MALTTLAFERRFGALVRPAFGPGGAGPWRRRRPRRPTTSRPTGGTRSGRGVPTWSSSGAGHGGRLDPLVRQEIAGLLAAQRASRWTAERARAGLAQGRSPGPEGSIGKLAASHVARGAAGARADRRGRCPAHGPRQPAGRADRRGDRVGPGPVDRRGHRRDPAQHPRREGPGPAREPAPERAAAFRDLPRNT